MPAAEPCRRGHFWVVATENRRRVMGVTDTQHRRTLAEPILAKLYDWIAAERPKLVDESSLAKASNYLSGTRLDSNQKLSGDCIDAAYRTRTRSSSARSTCACWNGAPSVRPE